MPQAVLKLFCASLIVTELAFAVPIDVIVRTGQQAVGTPSGISFSQFFQPTINHTGVVSFQALLAGPGVTMQNDGGIWSGGPQDISLMGREGDPGFSTPDGGNIIGVAGFPPSPIATHVGLAFKGVERTDGGDTVVGIWTRSTDGLQKVARYGDPAPGAPSGVTYGPSITTQFNYFGANPSGSITFEAGLTGPNLPAGPNRGIWRGPAGATELIVRTGDPVPETPGTFANFGDLPVAPVINSNGTVAFGANTWDMTPNPNNAGVWVGTPGNLTAFVRTGLPVPGLAGYFFGGGGSPSINDAGVVAVTTGATGAVDSFIGVWSGTPEAPTLVAASGQQVPGFPSNTRFENRFGPPVLNGQGRVAFLNSIQSPEGSRGGMWFGTSTDLHMVALDGNQAPDLPNGVLYNGFSSENPVLNSIGQLAFHAQLRGTGINGSNNSAIFAMDSDFVTKLIAQEGDSIEVAPGQFRVISSFSILANAGGEDGKPTALDNFGLLVFKVNFTDGSQAICSAQVPEPSSIGIIACLLGVRRLRRTV